MKIKEMDVQTFRGNFLALWKRSLIYLGRRLPEHPEELTTIAQMADGFLRKYQNYDISDFNVAWDTGLKKHLKAYPVKPSWNYGVLSVVIESNISFLPKEDQKLLHGSGLTPEQRAIKESWEKPVEDLLEDKIVLFINAAQGIAPQFLTGSALAPEFQRKMEGLFILMRNRMIEKKGEKFVLEWAEGIVEKWKIQVMHSFGRGYDFVDGDWREVYSRLQKTAQTVPNPELTWRKELVLAYAEIYHPETEPPETVVTKK